MTPWLDYCPAERTARKRGYKRNPTTRKPGVPGKENLINSTLRSMSQWNSHAFPNTDNGNLQTAIRLPKWQTALRAVGRRFDPITIGFLVGGVILGIGGCILGVFIPYRHPVSVTFSVLWWGFWLGFIGGYIGACVGELFFGPRGYDPPKP
jgi:hypothetical protein